MKKVICPVCGSDKVVSEKKMERTVVPESVRKRYPNRRISWGRVYFKNVCECNHVWEEETHL